MSARIDDEHPANFSLRASCRSQNLPHPRIYLVFVDVAYFADDGIKLSYLITASREVDQFPDFELGGGRRLKAAIHIVRIGNPILGNKTGAVDIRLCRCLEANE